MSLLPGGCTLAQLRQGLPFPLPMRDLASEMHDLRSRQIVHLKPARGARGLHGAAWLRRHSATPSRELDADFDAATLSDITVAKAAPRRGTVTPPSEPLTQPKPKPKP